MQRDLHIDWGRTWLAITARGPLGIAWSAATMQLQWEGQLSGTVILAACCFQRLRNLQVSKAPSIKQAVGHPCMCLMKYITH